MLGSLIRSGTPKRDAIHVAIIPIVAGVALSPGQQVSFGQDGKAWSHGNWVGVVDPFLEQGVRQGDTFWLVMKPDTVVALRHDWFHPAFDQQECHVEWMKAWAIKHTPGNYYDDERVDPDVAYDYAINAGHTNHIGPYENARDYIDDEWWDHWEAITGVKGKRGEYFSCGC